MLALAGANADLILDSLHGAARGCAGASLLVGALSLIASLVVALRGTPVPQAVADVSAEEVANYASDRFVLEPDLWRVQLRTIRGLLDMIEVVTRQGDAAAQAVRAAEYFFLVGLFSVGVALATLVVVVTF